MAQYIDNTFLENNLFEQSKICAGFPVWHYEEKGKYRVSIALRSDHGDPSIYVLDYNTQKSIEYHEHPHLLKESLKKCLEFMAIKDEFDYDAN